MSAERVIQVLVFVLLAFGLGVVSFWVSTNYLTDPMLMVASIPLGWGIILLVIYVCFKKLGWRWWD